jgi:hypothetical protein
MNFVLDYKDLGGREVNHHGDGDYDYDWTEDHDYHYYGASIVEGDGYSDVSLFPGEAEVELGDDIHIVYVSYDDGDSFGREYDRRVHLWAFSDRKRAYQLAEAIAADAEANPDYDFDHKPLMFEDVPISTNEWKGHFERFNRADVETVTVKRRG